MEGHEGCQEGMDDGSALGCMALAGRVRAVEGTSQCCTLWSRPLGLHLAAVGRMDIHLAQCVAHKGAQVAAEDVQMDWQHRTMYWEDWGSVSLDDQTPPMTVVGQNELPVSKLEPDQ